MLKTVMKNTAKEVENSEGAHCKEMCNDWILLKKVVVYMTITSKNAQLVCGCALEQEIETRPGMVCEVI